MPSGSANGRWNRERLLSSHGYVRVRVGADHPLADCDGYCYEHRIVWMAAGRRAPRPTQTLHHVNGDKQDNRLANLEVLSRSEHARMHAVSRRRRKDGAFAKERKRAA